MTSDPFFSVVVPIYNKAAFVERCIKSVLAQTFPRFELLLVNDASTDGSLNEISRFSDPRVRVLCRKTPGPGGYAARNLGIAKSRAEWVAFLDADDEWYPGHLALLRDLAMGAKGGVVASSWFWNHGDADLRRGAFSELYADFDQVTLGFAEFLHECANARMPMWTGSVAARRNLLHDVGGFPERCRRGGDTAVWLRLVKDAGQLMVSTKPTAVYHRMDSFVIAMTPAEVEENCVYDACKHLLHGTRDRRIAHLLKQVSNLHVSYGLRRRSRDGSLRFSDCNYHYLTANLGDHLLFRSSALMPSRLQRAMRRGVLFAKRLLLSRVGNGR